ncbi:MAG: YdcF family protein [Clostridia bacterium]|nr:YdcF family protein [Clostridia bacterium]
MKLSKISMESALNLSNTDKETIIYGGVTNDYLPTDVAVVLGGPVALMQARAYAGYLLYKKGLCKKFIVSGKPCNNTEFGFISEAKTLQNYLINFGVDPADILLEEEALTTHENMIFACLVINRNIKWQNVKKVTIVSSYSHIKRSLILAKMYFPKSVTIYGVHSLDEGEGPNNWFNSDKYAKSGDYEVRLLKELVDDNQCDDIDF